MPRISRIAIVHAALLLFAAALLGKAAQVQLFQRGSWAARAQRQQFVAADVPAARGAIYDAAGVRLAESRQLVRLAVAPDQVEDRNALARELTRLNLARAVVRRAVDTTRKWVVIPNRWLPSDVAVLTAMRGVHVEAALERDLTLRESTRRIVGHVNAEGRPVDGLELALDERLRGRAGRDSVARDALGRRFESPEARGVAPEPGDDVTLTINQELQEIAEQALRDAVARMGADGGDIIVLDPKSGEVRAIATVRKDPRSSGSPALSEPYEPGSTLKPFTAAALLSLGRARPDEVVNTENGFYTIAGRTIEDDHKAPSMTLSQVIAFSSNIGITKFAQRLSPREQYEAMRDLGFGTPTGVPYPAEASGTLYPPSRWSKMSPASIAMGYEITVTPLQIALAYGAIANGGELLEPALVKEIRASDGSVRYRHERRVVRRVMTPAVAATVREMLKGTVLEGTAKGAGLGNFALAGKTGTARRNVRGRYVRGQYVASFVGLFPADDPQCVIFVKLDNPQGGSYYGGKTAAPVSKVVLEAALAAEDAAFDRRALAASARRGSDTLAVAADSTAARAADNGVVAGADSAAGDADDGDEGGVASVFVLPLRAARPPRLPARAVPDVRGLTLREAVRVLHRAGLRVQLAGSGVATATAPAAGSSVAAGTLVRLTASPDASLGTPVVASQPTERHP